MPETPERRPPPSEAWLRAGLLGIALATLAHLGFGVFRHARDPDESQLLHGGWLIAQGKRLYVDFWDDHGPLLNQLGALYFRLGFPDDDSVVLPAFRAAFSAVLLATAALFFGLARRVRPADGSYAALALALFAASPVLSHKGIEVRGDNLLQGLWVASLLLWVRGTQTGRWSEFLGAGFAVGAGFLLSFKATQLGLTAGLMFLTWMALERRFAWRELAVYGVGAAAIPSLLALWQWLSGAWPAFAAAYATEGFTRPRFTTLQSYGALRHEALLWVCLAAASLAVVGVRAAQGRVPVMIACFAVAGASLVIQFVYLLPVHFLHSLTPAVAPVAIVAGWAFAEVFLSARRPARAARGALLLAAVAAVSVYEASTRRYDGVLLRRQLEQAERVAAVVPRGAWLFDGDTSPIAYPRPLPHPSLVVYVEQLIRSRRYPLDVVAELARKDVAWWEVDGRIRRIDHLLKDYRERNFLPLFDDLWVAGRLLPRSAAGEAELEIRAAGAYWWWAGADGGTLRVDGAPAGSPVTLADGSHRVAWTGSGPLLVTVAPPEHWPAALRRKLRGRATPSRGG